MTRTQTEAHSPAFSRRRGFLKNVLGIATGALGLMSVGRPRVAQGQQVAVNDPAILNFALNLEYLEAEYYTYAVTGQSIEALGIGVNGSGQTGPVVIKADPKVPFATAGVEQYAAQVAMDEQLHVKYIRSTLAAFGIEPVARPEIDLLDSFNTLAHAAGLPTPFDPFANETNFLLGAYIFEDVGVSAYHGASSLLKNGNILSAAAGVLAVEAYHSGLIRTILDQRGQGPATQAISAVRMALGGSTDYGVASGPGGAATIVVADANGLAPSRTTRQVLNIVYGAVNAESGLFFPSGVNGPIH